MPLEDRKCNVTKASIMCQALNLMTSFDDHKDTTRSELVILVSQREKLSLYKMPLSGTVTVPKSRCKPSGKGWGGRWEGGSGWGNTVANSGGCMAKTITIL